MGNLLTTYRFSVDDYHRMGEAGIFHPDDRLELIEGEIVCMSPIGSRHAGCVNGLIRIFAERLHRQALLSVQNPVRLSRHSEPQPDLALLRPRTDDYRSAHPEPADTLLIIEVSDTSLPIDREIKLRLYAEAGIPEVWIIDLNGEQVLTFAGMAGGSYERSGSHQRGVAISPVALPGVTLAIDEILG